MSDSILQRISHGNPAAVKECIAEYGPLVWSIARRWSRSAADAEDATQEIFIEIWRHASRFDPLKGSDKTFIAVIARRRLIDRLRRVRQEPEMEPLDVLEFTAWCVPMDAALETAIDVEKASRAFAELRREHREVLELALVNGLSHSEIASQLAIPIGTVKSWMRRGVVRVRELLHVEPETDRGGHGA